MSVLDAMFAGAAVVLAYASGRFHFDSRISAGLYVLAIALLMAAAWPK